MLNQRRKENAVRIEKQLIQINFTLVNVYSFFSGDSAIKFWRAAGQIHA